MCGIFGFQVREGETLTQYERTVLGMTLAREMENRGHDSFGGAIFHDKDVEVIKGLGRITSGGGELFRRISEADKVLCHTRAATTGSVTVPNSHPFEIGDVIGVHNGMIYNHKELNEKYGRKCEVDSQHIFAHLNDALDLEELEGYGTVFYTRRSEGFDRIYIFRTNSGSLSLAKFYRDKGSKPADQNHFLAVWASETSAIRKCAELLGCEWFLVTDRANELYYVENGIFYEARDEHNKTVEAKITAVRYTSSNSSNHTTYSTKYNEEDWDYDNGVWRYKRNRDKTLSNPSTGNKSNVLVYSGKESRKDRKKRRKIEISLRLNDMLWNQKTVEPLAENLRDTNTLAKTFRRDGTAVPLCIHCTCDLAHHRWGLCKGHRTQPCSAVPGIPCDNYSAKMCRDCGCYMVEGIHIKSTTQPGMVYCDNCSTICVPEAKPVDDADEGDDKLAKLLDEMSDDAGTDDDEEDDKDTRAQLLLGGLGGRPEDDADLQDFLMMGGVID